MQRWIAMMLLWCVTLPLWAASGATQVAQVEAGRESTRIFLPLDGPVEHDMLTLNNPPRLVLDLRGAGAPARMLGLPVPGDVVTMVRSGARAPGELRVVLDLAEMPRECQVRLEKKSARAISIGSGIASCAPRCGGGEPATRQIGRPGDREIQPQAFRCRPIAHGIGAKGSERKQQSRRRDAGAGYRGTYSFGIHRATGVQVQIKRAV